MRIIDGDGRPMYHETSGVEDKYALRNAKWCFSASLPTLDP